MKKPKNRSLTVAARKRFVCNAVRIPEGEDVEKQHEEWLEDPSKLRI